MEYRLWLHNGKPNPAVIFEQLISYKQNMAL